MALRGKYMNWRAEKDGDGIVWLYCDKENSGTNVLSKDVLTELDSALKELSEIKPKGLVIISGKKNGFIAGADINEFVLLKDRESAEELIRRGQSIFDSLEKLPFPTVAAINGFCMGGGLELALACRYRVADDSPGTRLGFPEVKLGIHPGFGGSVRSTRLVGSLAGLDMMLGGRMLDVASARKMGLVDMAVPTRHLKNAARLMVLNPPARKRPGWKRIAGMKIFRPLVARMVRKKVAVKAPKSHYPAPYALIDLWEKHFDNPDEMYEREAQSVATLLTGDTAQNLVRVFFLQDRLKSMGGKGDFKTGHLHVVGAGSMGGDIAAWSVLRGMKVTLQDMEAKFISSAIKRAYKLFNKRLKKRRAVQEAMDRLIPDVKGDGIGKADLIIEAVFEDLSLKRDVLKDVEEKAGKDAVLATNTSSIPIEDIAEVLKKPERLVGIHFFNPVAQMMLVEVVKGTSTSEKVLSSAISYVQQINKLPLPVKSTPGFLVNRVLMQYLFEGVNMITENIPPERIDKAATEFGMPIGPAMLADMVGLDICLHVAKIFSRYMEMEIPGKLKEMVEAGNLGKKSGKGFYRYKNGKPKKDRRRERGSLQEIKDRLIFRFLNESVASLRNGVVEDADLIDAGMIFGTGFAPFRGGPMHYISTMGIDSFSERFKELESKYGSRFKMDKGWASLKGKI